MTENALPNDIKKKVEKWLMEDGWTLQEESTPSAIWTLSAEDNAGRKILVGQQNSRKDQLFVQASVVLDEMTNKIAQLEERKRSDFLWDLRFELLRTNLEFGGIQLPLERVGVSGRIFSDSLTRGTLLQLASQVRKGILAIQWMLWRKFEQQPPQEGFSAGGYL